MLAQKLYLENECKKIQESKLNVIEKVYASYCNSVLIKLSEQQDADIVYEKLKNNGIVVRNFGKKQFLENCLRISVGTPEENLKVVSLLKEQVSFS